MKPATATPLSRNSLFHVVEGTKVKIGRGAQGDVMQISCSDGSTVILETRHSNEYLIEPGSNDYTEPSPMEVCENPNEVFLWLPLPSGGSGLHSVADVRLAADRAFARRDGWFLPPSKQTVS